MCIVHLFYLSFRGLLLCIQCCYKLAISNMSLPRVGIDDQTSWTYGFYSKKFSHRPSLRPIAKNLHYTPFFLVIKNM